MSEPAEWELVSLNQDQPGEACNLVLIAEDDVMFRKILQTWLESWGYKVMIAVDGGQAWEMLQGEVAPHLLILDWMMPKLNGVEVCRLLRARNHSPYQYVLLVTAKDGTTDLVAGLEAGADDYLSKPFNKNELRARLRTGRRILTLQADQLKAHDKLQYQATHDGLTGVWNRNAILDILGREFERSSRSHSSMGVVILDLDHFKKVNDTHGHPAGDLVLREAVGRIQEALRSYDFVGRYGGEEFLIVIPDCSEVQVERCAERVRLRIAAEPVYFNGVEIPVTASLGVAVTSSLPSTPKEALEAADTALYSAKNGGRNRVVLALAA
ncbi:diguanylate cyclase (GGDEF)-like protein [Granulicella aggregans]|uniref:diguanylate cyclase n=1 Tax=Granulicella aggregans TaxID=474949 RepID=A0A7W7ZGG5_9BACT|nr:diguanylate cyclase [Granulicella aggregans]MBB5059293.1 diguanylate cyclase (GGDEF)-like protein [Granulicella aggregans]